MLIIQTMIVFFSYNYLFLQYRGYSLKVDGKALNVLLCDSMGLEIGTGDSSGLEMTKIDEILEGKVKDGSKVTTICFMYCSFQNVFAMVFRQ